MLAAWVAVVLLAGAAGCGALPPAGEAGSRAQGQQPAGTTAASDDATFSRERLTPEQQTMYDQLYQGIVSREGTIHVTSDDPASDLQPAFNAVLDDHPEIHWLDGSCTYRNGLGGVDVTPGLGTDDAQIDAVGQQLERVADEWAAQLPEDATDYQKVRAAYEYVILNTDYGFGSPQNQNIQSVLLDHESVCAGYARTVEYLLRRVGVWCTYIPGEAKGDAHAWNLVRVDGAYTYVDATWGDPAYLSTVGEAVQDVDITYDYLCVTSNELGATHTPDEGDLPECMTTDYDWYRLNGYYFDTLGDGTQLADAFWSQVGDGSQSAAPAFKFADDATYEQAKELATSGQFLPSTLQSLARRRGLETMKYGYSFADDLRVVRLYV